MIYPFRLKEIIEIYEALIKGQYPKIILNYNKCAYMPKVILNYYNDTTVVKKFLTYDKYVNYGDNVKEYYERTSYSYTLQEITETYDDPNRRDIPIQVNHYINIDQQAGYPKKEKGVINIGK